MTREPSERDLQIRAAIEEWEEARINRELTHESTDLWQQENVPPRRPKIIESIAEIGDYERESEEWNRPYQEQRERRHEADMRLQRATKHVESLLPAEYEYRHGKKLYRIGSSGLVARDQPDGGRSS